MTGSVERDGAGVAVLPVPAQMIGEKAREIGALFPGWRVWHDSWWAPTWNAYREGEQPYFGPGAGGRQFMRARLMSCLVGVDGLEPSTSSLSGNDVYRICFRFFALSCCPWSTLVRWCPLLSAAIVTQFVTRPRDSGLTTPTRTTAAQGPLTSSAVVVSCGGQFPVAKSYDWPLV